MNRVYPLYNDREIEMKNFNENPANTQTTNLNTNNNVINSTDQQNNNNNNFIKCTCCSFVIALVIFLWWVLFVGFTPVTKLQFNPQNVTYQNNKIGVKWLYLDEEKFENCITILNNANCFSENTKTYIEVYKGDDLTEKYFELKDNLLLNFTDFYNATTYDGYLHKPPIGNTFALVLNNKSYSQIFKNLSFGYVFFGTVVYFLIIFFISMIISICNMCAEGFEY